MLVPKGPPGRSTRKARSLRRHRAISRAALHRAGDPRRTRAVRRTRQQQYRQARSVTHHWVQATASSGDQAPCPTDAPAAIEPCMATDGSSGRIRYFDSPSDLVQWFEGRASPTWCNCVCISKQPFPWRPNHHRRLVASVVGKSWTSSGSADQCVCTCKQPVPKRPVLRTVSQTGVFAGANETRRNAPLVCASTPLTSGIDHLPPC